MKYYRANKKIFRSDVTGFWRFEAGHWIRNVYDLHLDNIEPVQESEAEQELSLRANNAIDMYIKAEEMAREAHRGQTDKAGKDYFESHVLPVSRMVPDEPWLVLIALLHDTIEDTHITEEKLRCEFPAEVVDAVVTLTRKDGEPYEDYIERVKGNRLAVKVKICDLMQNMDLTRLASVTEEDIERVEKYSRALTSLARTLY